MKKNSNLGKYIGNVIEVPSDHLYTFNEQNLQNLYIRPDSFQTDALRERRYALKLQEHYVWFEGNMDGLKKYYRTLGQNNLYLVGCDKNMFWMSAPVKFRAIHLPLGTDIALAMGDLLFSSGIKIGTNESDEKIQKTVEEISDEWAQLSINDKLREVAVNASWAGTGFAKWDFDPEFSNLPILSVIHPINVRVYERNGFPYRFDIFEKVKIKNTYYKVLEVRELVKDKKNDKIKLNISHHLLKASGIIHELKSVKLLLEESKKLMRLWNSPELKNYDFKTITEVNTNSLLTIAVPNNKPDFIMKSNVYGRSDFENNEALMDSIDENFSTLMNILRKNKPVRYIPEHLLPRDKEGRIIPYDDFELDYYRISADAAGMESGNNTIITDEPDFELDIYQENYQFMANILILNVGLTPYTLGFQGTGLDGRDLSDRRERFSQRTREKKRRIWEPFLNTLVSQYQIVKELFIKGKNKKYLEDCDPIYATIRSYHIPTIEGRVDFWGDARRNGACDVVTMVDEVFLDKSPEERKRMIDDIRAENRLDSAEDKKRKLRVYKKSLEKAQTPPFLQQQNNEEQSGDVQLEKNQAAVQETTESKDSKAAKNPDKKNKGDNKAKGMLKKEKKGV